MQQRNRNICYYCRSAEAQCSCPRAFAGVHICTYFSHRTADEYEAIVKERDALKAALGVVEEYAKLVKSVKDNPHMVGEEWEIKEEAFLKAILG